MSTVAHFLIKSDHLSKLNLCDVVVSGLLAFAFFLSLGHGNQIGFSFVDNLVTFWIVKCLCRVANKCLGYFFAYEKIFMKAF